VITTPIRCDSLESAIAPCFQVDLHIEIPAEQIRVFQAVTIAEYVEMWCASPRRSEVTCQSEVRPGGGYRLSVYRRGRSIFEVKGEFVVYEPFEMIVCSLEHSTFPHSPRSFFTLKLDQSKEVTALVLAHTGLSSVEEADYFLTMWTKCLGRLKNLLVPRHTVTD
jgi:uncharacterized protein YndB with AHSA1/START domain